MVCPDCNSISIGKEVTRRGWSGDYVCWDCGYNNSKDSFLEKKATERPPLKLKLKEKPSS